VSLFDDVVAASGLSRVIAPFTISRLLISAGVIPSEMTPQDLARALPGLDAGLALYLEGPELEAASRAIHELASAP